MGSYGLSELPSEFWRSGSFAQTLATWTTRWATSVMSNTLFAIALSAARYLKLGVYNSWIGSCRANDRIKVGHRYS